jgi:hypothetical protein
LPRKKYYQVLIALLGLIPFIIYFIFWQNVWFFSVAGSDSIFSLLSALAISDFGLFVILYISRFAFGFDRFLRRRRKRKRLFT